jgi:hypothetical protein
MRNTADVVQILVGSGGIQKAVARRKNKASAGQSRGRILLRAD